MFDANNYLGNANLSDGVWNSSVAGGDPSGMTTWGNWQFLSRLSVLLLHDLVTPLPGVYQEKENSHSGWCQLTAGHSQQRAGNRWDPCAGTSS